MRQKKKFFLFSLTASVRVSFLLLCSSMRRIEACSGWRKETENSPFSSLPPGLSNEACLPPLSLLLHPARSEC